MTTTEFVQAAYVVLITLGFAWSLASIVSVAGTRGALRTMTTRGAFIHDDSTRGLHNAAFLTLALLMFAVVAWGVTRVWPVLWSPSTFW